MTTFAGGGRPPPAKAITWVGVATRPQRIHAAGAAMARALAVR